MAWLFIDTHVSKICRAGWLEAGKRGGVRTLRGRPKRILKMLERTSEIVSHHLDGVCVVAGPGSFSAVRTGVLYANLLARLQRVPLIGIRIEQFISFETLTCALAEGKFSPASYVAPIYEAEPNITLPRPNSNSAL